jgi:hypothetical protein
MSRRIFEASNVGMSCQTTKRKPWKQALSMVSTVLDDVHRLVAGGLDEAHTPLEVSVSTNGASLGRKGKTVPGTFQAL